MAALVEYSREIGPLVRQIETKKQILKDFKTTDEKAIELAQNVADGQAELKKYVAEQNKELLDEIKALEGELKQAVQAAARSTKDTDRPFTVGELKPYFKARNKPHEMGKPSPVKKVIVKGDTFEELETKIGKD
jgi:cell division septum initiation protein DivIVA